MNISSASSSSDLITHAVKRLIDVTQELSHCRDIGMVMDAVRRAARDLTGADGATFVLRDGDYCYYAEENAISPLWKGQRFPMEICISGWVMQHGHPVIIRDVFADPRIPPDIYKRTFVKSMTMVPIRKQNPLGAIGNYWAYNHYSSPEELSLLESLANITSIAIENTELYSRLQTHIKSLEVDNRELRGQIGETERSSPQAVTEIVHGIDILEYLNEQLNIPSSFRLKTKGEFNDLPMPRIPLQQIFCNLVRNAIDHHHLDTGMIMIGLEESSTHYIFSVEDDGPGIPLPERQKIHSIFQSQKNHDLSQGSQLGLKIVKKILDAYDGSIQLKCHPGKGSTFIFKWPKA